MDLQSYCLLGSVLNGMPFNPQLLSETDRELLAASNKTNSRAGNYSELRKIMAQTDATIPYFNLCATDADYQKGINTKDSYNQLNASKMMLLGGSIQTLKRQQAVVSQRVIPPSLGFNLKSAILENKKLIEAEAEEKKEVEARAKAKKDKYRNIGIKTQNQQ